MSSSTQPIRKVVVNGCFGGFSLSSEGEEAYLARKGKQAFFYVDDRTNGSLDLRTGKVNRVTAAEADNGYFITYTVTEDLGEQSNHETLNDAASGYFSDRDIKRDDPDLVAVVEELGEKADGRHASLRVVEIPADVEWVVSEYDGLESVEEAHRSWT